MAGLACGAGQEVAPASVVRQAQEAKELAVRVDSAADEADMVVVVATAIMVDGAAAQAVKVVAPAAGAAEEG